MAIKSPGKKYDDGKDRWDLLPMEPIVYLVKVLTHGSKKYGDWNWQEVDEAKSRYYAACMRHLSQWRLGETNDEESGLPHLAHAMCCIVFLLWGEL